MGCAVLCSVAQSCLTLCNPVDCSLPGSSVHGDFSGKSTGVGCHFLLQGIFLDQGSSPRLPHWQADALPLSHRGSQEVEQESLLKSSVSYQSRRQASGGRGWGKRGWGWASGRVRAAAELHAPSALHLPVPFRASYSPFVLTFICEWMSAFSMVPGTQQSLSKCSQ